VVSSYGELCSAAVGASFSLTPCSQQDIPYCS